VSLAIAASSRPGADEVLGRLRQRGVEAQSLCADSRLVAPGDVFLAYPGARSDGRRYLGDAVRRGAAAVLWEAEEADCAVPVAIPGFAVSGLRDLAGPLAHRVYGRPSERLWVVGVTGTNGKTSVSQWIAQCMTRLGRKCAVIGTLGSGYPDRLRAGLNTTPDAISLQRDLAGFVAEGAAACAMEVSSIGLDQGRVAGVAFAVAVLTNLTLDHLDYHGSMEAYGAAKRRLFAMPGIGAAVLNLDDPYGVDVAQRLAASGIERIGYSLEAARGDCTDRTLFARDLDFAGHGLRFTVDGVAFAAPLVGRFNVSNLLAVIGALLAGGVSLADAAAAIAAVEAPPGRMQALGGRGEPLLVVDYAHTPDALEKALLTLRDTAQTRGGRLLCVFGCGGERDHAKRPVMGGIAVRHADGVWITSDNPRGENPAAIIGEILAGTGGEPDVEIDRGAAVAAAVAAAAAADVVLVAGKGHEAYQEMAGVRQAYSDVEQALAALAAWRSRR